MDNPLGSAESKLTQMRSMSYDQLRVVDFKCLREKKIEFVNVGVTENKLEV